MLEKSYYTVNKNGEVLSKDYLWYNEDTMNWTVEGIYVDWYDTSYGNNFRFWDSYSYQFDSYAEAISKFETMKWTSRVSFRDCEI